MEKLEGFALGIIFSFIVNTFFWGLELWLNPKLTIAKADFVCTSSHEVHEPIVILGNNQRINTLIRTECDEYKRK